jgi:steroid delta-isomerase-like uncharacterized protein
VTEQERVLREFYAAFNAGDLERAAQQFASECEWDFPAFGMVERSPEEILENVLRPWKTSFPDGRVEVVNAISCDSFVIIEWDSRGTWTGPLRGEEPNGRSFERRGCAVAELQGGKIVRCRDYFDRANMYEPLGLMHLMTD